MGIFNIIVWWIFALFIMFDQAKKDQFKDIN